MAASITRRAATAILKKLESKDCTPLQAARLGELLVIMLGKKTKQQTDTSSSVLGGLDS